MRRVALHLSLLEPEQYHAIIAAGLDCEFIAASLNPVYGPIRLPGLVDLTGTADTRWHREALTGRKIGFTDAADFSFYWLPNVDWDESGYRSDRHASVVARVILSTIIGSHAWLAYPDELADTKLVTSLSGFAGVHRCANHDTPANALQSAIDAFLPILRAMPYAQYLTTPHWLRTRERALVRAGMRCANCDALPLSLDAHHLTYERLGNEQDSDLRVLCRPCHDLAHIPKAGR